MKKNEIDSQESIQRLTYYLYHQLEVVIQVRDEIAKKKEDIWPVVFPLLWSAEDSARSLMILAQYGKMRDCMILARSIFETIINAAFICAGGTQVAGRAQQHAFQKSYRGMAKFEEFKGSYLPEKPKMPFGISNIPEAIPELKTAIEAYTGRKGREITAWTPESVKARIDMIMERYERKSSRVFDVILCAIYRDSSELVHGTLYGAFFALGERCGMNFKNPEEFRRFKLGVVSEMLGLINFAFCELIGIIGEEISVQSAVEESNRITSMIGNHFWPSEKNVDQQNNSKS